MTLTGKGMDIDDQIVAGSMANAREHKKSTPYCYKATHSKAQPTTVLIDSSKPDKMQAAILLLALTAFASAEYFQGALESGVWLTSGGFQGLVMALSETTEFNCWKYRAANSGHADVILPICNEDGSPAPLPYLPCPPLIPCPLCSGYAELQFDPVPRCYYCVDKLFRVRLLLDLKVGGGGVGDGQTAKCPHDAEASAVERYGAERLCFNARAYMRRQNAGQALS